MIPLQGYTLKALHLKSDSVFLYKKTQKRKNKFNPIPGVTATKNYDYIETPNDYNYQIGQKIRLIDECGAERRINDIQEILFNEMQLQFCSYENCDKVYILELE